MVWTWGYIGTKGGSVKSETNIESHWTLICVWLRLYIADIELDIIMSSLILFVRILSEEEVFMTGLIFTQH